MPAMPSAPASAAGAPGAPGDTVAVTVASRRWETEWPQAEGIARTAALHTLAHARAGARPALDATIVLADDAGLRALNRRFRRRDAATNVLAFPLEDAFSPPLPLAGDGVGAARPIGDVAIAYETVLREAGEQAKAPAAHLAHLVAHGVLHLLGFDHRNEEEHAEMSRSERAILARLGHGDPLMSPGPGAAATCGDHPHPDDEQRRPFFPE